MTTISPWIGRRAEVSGRRPLLLVGWGLIPLQVLLYATVPDLFGLVFGNQLNAFSVAIFGVVMTVVATDLTRRTGCFNLTLGALGVAVAIGASLSTFCTGISAALFGVRATAGGLAAAMDRDARDAAAPESARRNGGSRLSMMSCGSRRNSWITAPIGAPLARKGCS